MKRRIFLRAIGAGLILTATGPLRLRNGFTREEDPRANITEDLMENEYPSEVIDVHTHIFNARYIPLVGALHSKGVPKWLGQLLKPLFNVLAGGERHFEATRGRNSFIRHIRDNGDPNRCRGR